MIFLVALLILGTVFLIHILTAKYGFRNVSYSLRFSADEAVEGDTVTLTETICNRKLLPLPWVKAELTTDASLVFASEQSSVAEETRFVFSCFCLFPYRQIERSWRVKCTKRGIFTVSHAVLVISDLFSTFEHSRPFPDSETAITVLPSAERSQTLSANLHRLTGDHILPRTLMPDRFAVCGIRSYTEGDPVRDLALSATVRFGNPMVWQYYETAENCSTILLNLETRETDRDTVSDKACYENCIRLCAALFTEASSGNLPVRFCANTNIGETPVDSGIQNSKAELHSLLQILAALTYDISCRFSVLLKQLASDQPVIIVTPFLSQDVRKYAYENPQSFIFTLKPPRQNDMLDNIRFIPAEAFLTERSSPS
ncbi:MAG: DUF58 domain-containing protein [Oscillospiraceae bacterium]|nr:DUF58 domain-containing protein [Oscillospiraceae bacterium]